MRAPLQRDRREPISVRTAHQNRARTQADCFHDIAAAADPAIHQHLDLAFYRGDHFGKRAQRW